jgi:hypothetical protein
MEGRRLVLPIDFGILAAAIGKFDDGGDKVPVSVKTARNGRADIDADDSLLFCPQLKLPDPGFRTARQDIGAVALTEEAQHGKSPDSGAEDGNNLKPKLYKIDPRLIHPLHP